MLNHFIYQTSFLNADISIYISERNDILTLDRVRFVMHAFESNKILSELSFISEESLLNQHMPNTQCILSFGCLTDNSCIKMFVK